MLNRTAHDNIAIYRVRACVCVARARVIERTDAKPLSILQYRINALVDNRRKTNRLNSLYE